MRAWARRWLWLHEEIITQDKALERFVPRRTPAWMASHGIATLTIAVGGDRQANAALYRVAQANAALNRVAVARLRRHEPTLAYVKKRTKDAKSKSEIIRCLKRYIFREIKSQLCVPKMMPQIES